MIRRNTASGSRHSYQNSESRSITPMTSDLHWAFPEAEQLRLPATFHLPRNSALWLMNWLTRNCTVPSGAPKPRK